MSEGKDNKTKFLAARISIEIADSIKIYCIKKKITQSIFLQNALEHYLKIKKIAKE